MDRLTSMAVFVRAADAGSFVAVAEAMGMSGPMVGKHIRFLEDSLGVELISRTTRRHSMTDIGRAYYDRCRVILAEVLAAEGLAAEHLNEARGTLRLTLPAQFGRLCAAPVLLDLIRQHPALGLEMSFGDAIADLADAGFDLAIRTGDLGELSGLSTRVIARQRMVLCASSGCLEQHGTPATLAELERLPAIVYSRAGGTSSWLFQSNDGATIRFSPSGRLRMDDLAAIASAAEDGFGLAWLPFWLVAGRIATGALQVLPLDAGDYYYLCHALWPDVPRTPLRTRLAIDALVKALPAMTE